MFESFLGKLTLSGQTSVTCSSTIHQFLHNSSSTEKNSSANFQAGTTGPNGGGGVCVTIRGGTDMMTSSVEIRMGGGGGQSLSEDWGQSKVMQK